MHGDLHCQVQGGADKTREIYIELENWSSVRLFWKYLEWNGQEEGLLFGAAQGGRLSTQAIISICQRIVAVAGLQVRACRLEEQLQQ